MTSLLPSPAPRPRSQEYQGILQEVLYLLVRADGEVAVLLDENLMDSLSPEAQDATLKDLITLGLASLERDSSTAPRTRPERILLEDDPQGMLALRFLLSPSGEFQLLMNFGKAFPRRWTEASGVLYARDMVLELKETLGI